MYFESGIFGDLGRLLMCKAINKTDKKPRTLFIVHILGTFFISPKIMHLTEFSGLYTELRGKEQSIDPVTLVSTRYQYQRCN